MVRQDVLGEIVRGLPHLASEAIEDRARSVLRFVLDPDGTYVQSPQVSTQPETCPNCNVKVVTVRSPYCGETCREIAGFVRQIRSGIFDASLNDPDRQVALGQILWKLLGGGLPFRNSLIEPRPLARLFEKYEGKCSECGKAATTVDHIGSHCNRTSNLRPMCDACAKTKPFGDATVLARPESQSLQHDLSQRILSECAVRVCDDAATWDWRAYLAERKRLIASRCCEAPPQVRGGSI